VGSERTRVRVVLDTGPTDTLAERRPRELLRRAWYDGKPDRTWSGHDTFRSLADDLTWRGGLLNRLFAALADV
jgi:hypothetical protein